jgi:hypothetical protein
VKWWRYSGAQFQPQHYTEVNVELHASAALPPGKDFMVLIVQEAGWTRGRSGLGEEERNHCPS